MRPTTPNTDTSTLSARQEFARGWRPLVAASVGYGAGVGLFVYVNGIFMRYLEGDLGWSRASIAAASFATLVSALLNPLVGRAIDRFSARGITLIAIPLFSASYLVLASIPGQIWAFYLAIAMLVMVGAATGPIGYTKIVNQWFSTARGLALRLCLAGTAITSAIVFPLLSWILENYGWRAGYLFLGGFSFLVAMPLVRAWLRAPEGLAETRAALAAARIGESLRNPAFSLLVAAMMVANIGVGGLVQHLQPMLGDRGVSPEVAAFLGSFFVSVIALTRVSTGFLLDRFNPSLVAMAILLLAASGAVIMLYSSGSTTILLIAIGLMAMAHGAEVDLLAFFTPRLFGLPNYAIVFGILTMIVVMSAPLGGVLYGAIYDSTASYDLALKVGAAGYVAAGLCFFCLPTLGRSRD